MLNGHILWGDIEHFLKYNEDNEKNNKVKEKFDIIPSMKHSSPNLISSSKRRI